MTDKQDGRGLRPSNGKALREYTMTSKLSTKSFLAAAGLCALFALPATAADYVFTAPPRDAGGDESDVYQPVADYLSKVTGKRIVYQYADNWLTYQDKMRKGEYDIMFDGPHFLSWRIAKLQHEPLAKLPGKLVFATIARKENEKVNSMRDLAGRPVCGLAPPNLATLTLTAQFDNPARQPLILEVKSFKDAYDGVLNGKCLAASLPAGALKKLDEQKQAVKVIYQSDGVPNQGFSAGARFTADERAKMSAALLMPEAQTKMVKFFDTWNKGKDLAPANRGEYENVVVLLKDTYGFDVTRVSAVDTKPGK